MDSKGVVMLAKLWERYLVWRRAEGVAAAVHPSNERIKKVDASDEDLIREATANRGAGWAGSG